MKNVVACGYGILLAVAAAGCGKANAEELVKELLAAENDNVRFGEDAKPNKLNWDELEEIGQRLMDVQSRLAAMPKEEVDAAKEKYKDEFLKLEERKYKLNSKFLKRAVRK